MTTRTEPSGPITVTPGTIVARSRARARATSTGGSGQTHGGAKYTDDLVFPGAWYGATIRSTDAHARLSSSSATRASTGRSVVVVTAADIPGENIVELDQGRPADPRPDRRRDPPPRRADRPHGRSRPGDPSRPAAGSSAGPSRCPRSSTRSCRDACVRRLRHRPGRRRTRLSPPPTSCRGRVPRRSPGAALHREQRDDRRPVRRRRRHRSRLAPVPVLRPQARSSGASGWTMSRRRVVQAETGGGFGGKEEYPSMIGAPRGAPRGSRGRPVRMIYDRHEDIAATTKRHPAIVRHRTGVTHDGRLLAQDIEVVMDGGAYCTLTPVVLSRGALHAGGPYHCPNVRIRARATRDEHAAERRVPRVRRAADRVRGRDPPEPDRRSARHRPLAIRRWNVYQPGDTTPTGQVLRDSVAGEEVLERAAEAAEFERLRERTGRARASAPDRGRSRRRRCERRAIVSRAVSGSRSPGTGQGSPGPARSGLPRSHRSSSQPRARSGS